MKINSARFGEINVNQSDIIKFPEGLIGFPDYTKFIIIENEEEKPFRTLQSVDEASFSHLVVNPLISIPDYTFETHQNELAIIGAESVETLNLYVTVKIGQSVEDVTVDLKGPILINPDRNLGIQFVLTDSDYAVNEKLLPSQ